MSRVFLTDDRIRFFFWRQESILFSLAMNYICNVVHTCIVSYKNAVVHMSALGRILRCNIYNNKVEHVSGYMFDCNSATLILLIKAATGNLHFCWLWRPLWTESGVSPLCCKYPDLASLWLCLKVCETKTQKISSLNTAVCTMYSDVVMYPSVATQFITVLDNVETKLCHQTTEQLVSSGSETPLFLLSTLPWNCFLK